MLNFSYQQPSKENVVVNLSLYNPTDANNKISARIDVPLEKPILRKMSDYKLTILRFQCPLTTVFPPYSLQGTEFQVTISTSTHSESRLSTGGALSSYIGDFLEFLLNPLINACHSAMVSFINGADAKRPPYVYYQPQEKLMHFVVPAEYAGSVNIFVNRAVYKFISGFPFQKIDDDNYMLRYYVPDNSILYSPPVQKRSTNFQNGKMLERLLIYLKNTHPTIASINCSLSLSPAICQYDKKHYLKVHSKMCSTPVIL
jgi:hypothetical protein